MKEMLKRLLKLSPIPLSKNHRYDLQTNKILNRCLAPDSNCVDVGCFKGEILDLMLNKSPSGVHYGIEPIPKFYKYLSDKYQAASNCHIVNCAASNHKGTSSFNYVTSNPSYSGLLKRNYDRPNEQDTEITVETCLLDDIIPAELRIDLIKIDVEGAELRVLEGAGRILSDFQPVVIFEHGLGASDIYGNTPGDVFSLFGKYNMKISTLSAYLKNQAPLARAQFETQYRDSINYYFIAHR